MKIKLKYTVFTFLLLAFIITPSFTQLPAQITTNS